MYKSKPTQGREKYIYFKVCSSIYQLSFLLKQDKYPYYLTEDLMDSDFQTFYTLEVSLYTLYAIIAVERSRKISNRITPIHYYHSALKGMSDDQGQTSRFPPFYQVNLPEFPAALRSSIPDSFHYRTISRITSGTPSCVICHSFRIL